MFSPAPTTEHRATLLNGRLVCASRDHYVVDGMTIQADPQGRAVILTPRNEKGNLQVLAIPLTGADELLETEGEDSGSQRFCRQAAAEGIAEAVTGSTSRALIKSGPRLASVRNRPSNRAAASDVMRHASVRTPKASNPAPVTTFETFQSSIGAKRQTDNISPQRIPNISP